MATGTLHPTNDLAPRVLLPGDPGRALALAQLLLDKPLMSNHHRGLWGYTGLAADGQPLTIQSSGIGGPSAAAVVSDLAELGVREIVRVGSCRGPLEPGTLIAVTAALCADGTSRALGAGDRVEADPELTAPLAEAASRSGVVASADLFDQPLPDGEAIARDLQTAAVLQLARVRGMRAAAVLAVVEPAPGGDEDAVAQLTAALGHVAATALVSA